MTYFSDTPPVFKKRKRPNRLWVKIIRRTILILVWSVAALLGYVAWQAQSIVDEFHAGAKQEIVDQAEPQLDIQPKHPFRHLKSAETYLLVGSDVRPTETDEGRSDTIVLVRVYPDQKIASMLSIPRDLYVPIPGYGDNRINAAYSYGGIGLLIETLREWLGVPINHFFQVDFSGFADVVDQLGGVYLPIDQRYYHVNDGSLENDWSSIDLQPGYQKLKGADALAWVRFRHLDSDFYRAARQQIFLREVGRELEQKESDPFALRDLIKTIAKATASDMDSVDETLSLANTLRQIPPQNIVRVTIDAPETVIDGMDVLVPDKSDIDKALEEWGNPQKMIAKQGKRPSPSHYTKLAGKMWKALNRYLYAKNDKVFAFISSRLYKHVFQQLKKRSARSLKHSGHLEDSLEAGVPAPSLLLKTGPIRHCIPTALPPDYHWPDEDAARTYKLNGYPAIAAYATKASGVSALWMWTTWNDPPILDAASDAVRIHGKVYRVYWDSGSIRMIAWKTGNTTTWITNTLRNELTNKDMLALAGSCH